MTAHWVHVHVLCVLMLSCSVKKGTEQAAQATVDAASSYAGSVRSTVSNLADSVRSAPDTLAQVRQLMSVLVAPSPLRARQQHCMTPGMLHLAVCSQGMQGAETSRL